MLENRSIPKGMLLFFADHLDKKFFSRYDKGESLFCKRGLFYGYFCLIL